MWAFYLIIWGILSFGVGLSLMRPDTYVYFGIGLSLVPLAAFHLLIGIYEYSIYQKLAGLTSPDRQADLIEQLRGQLAKMQQRRTAESVMVFGGLFVFVTGALLDWQPVTVGFGAGIAISFAFSLILKKVT